MGSRRARRLRMAVVAAGLVPLLSSTNIVGAGTGSSDLDQLEIPGGPVTVDGSLDHAAGNVDVVVQLARDPLAKAVGAGAKQGRPLLDKRAQQAYVRSVKADQDAFAAAARSLGAVETSRVSKVLNAVTLRIDASKLDALAQISGVRSIRPVGEYQLDLSETVPYIGATAMHNDDVDGTGVRVAVLDSGIDYTHANLGGAGTLAAYDAAYGTSPADPKNTTADGLFPTAKVVGGYDFVGDAWPSGALAPDPDPIDFEGHGTHVADIIAGTNGVAPGASLYAVKVCSAVSTSCSGVALIQGMEFAVDPNGDGSIDDAVDVVNMSLGSSYGQRQDDLSFASANAVAFGVTVVVSAGNSADRPYIVGSPSSTPGVISVAQTQVPSAIAYALRVDSPANIAGFYRNTATVEWAPIVSGFTGEVAYIGRGCPGDTLLANPAGKVALIDRGACAVSLKVDVAADAGAIGVLVANNTAGDAPSFSFGGGDTMVQTLILTQSTGSLIKANLAAPVIVTVSPTDGTPLVGSMVATSSRGPSYSFDAIKPDVGAPGASVSAIAGTGTGTEAFGGTSGAAPMVSGAAALLLDKFGPTAPHVVKARLMGSAETNITTNPATQPGVLAPITRIGGGEVRVDRAAAATILAWAEGDDSANAASLSFGFVDASSKTTITKRLRITNVGNADATYTLTPTFRYADDAASGAVTVSAPGSVKVKKGQSTSVVVKLTIDPAKLPAWNLDLAANQGNGALLNAVEFDGYLKISKTGETVTVPWHVLPRKAANTSASTSSLALGGGTGTVAFTNGGAEVGYVDLFALDGTSPKDYPKPFQGGDGDNFVTPDIQAVGSRDYYGYLQFGVNFWNDFSHPAYPIEVDVYIDTDRDGTDDYVVYTAENGGFAVTGQTLVYVVNLHTGTGGAHFYLDADLNASNMILTVPYSALGVTAGTQIDYSVYVFDNYFTGAVTDFVGPFTVTPSTPKFTASANELAIPKGGSASVDVTATPGGDTASPTQQGILALYRLQGARHSHTAILVTA